MLLFVDTETTGKINFDLPLTHPDQPRLVQLAAYLAKDDADASHVSSIDWIVQPDGWTIPEDATRIHGISTERARAFGRPLGEVLTKFFDLVARADNGAGSGRLIAHNIDFDLRMLLAEYERCELDFVSLQLLRPFCTMRAMTERCKLPGRWRGKYKWPTLDEAWAHVHDGQSLPQDGRHTAMFDLLACRDIFVEGRRREWWR